MINELFEKNLHVINVGLVQFYEDLEKQNIDVVQVEWKVPSTTKRGKELLKKLLLIYGEE